MDHEENHMLKLVEADKNVTTKYVALSYPWARSVYEEPPSYTWHIKENNSSRKSGIRDAVLDRVSKFMLRFKVDHLWIDSECINQRNEDEKEHVMSKMHLVYANSSHPLALLFVPIRTPAELALLARLLSGNLTRPAHRRKCDEDEVDEYTLVRDTNQAEAYAILDLIHRILSDEWWSRAWCFQEEYVSMAKLKLLLPTFVDVSRKQETRIMSFLDGEVVICAKRFRKAVTQFVFAYVATVNQMSWWKLDGGLCRHILEKAGWYVLISRHGHTLSLDSEGKAMSTQILADLRRKKYTVPSDLLHISSNCNYYVSTLNTRTLNEENESLALSMVALFFLNGEIFRNGSRGGPTLKQAADLNAFEYLRCITFDDFPANGGPGEQAKLRKCRFVSPTLTDLGVQSLGRVWQIDQVLQLPSDIWSSTNSSQSSGDGSSVEDDADDETWRVLTTIRDVLGRSNNILVRRLDEFLAKEFNKYWHVGPPKIADAFSEAASNFVQEIYGSQLIGLGHLIGPIQPTGSTSTRLGLFSVDKKANKQIPIYAFTAWQAGSEGKHWYERILKEEKRVSLQVSVDEPQAESTTLCLRTKALIHSLCFCDEVEQIPVIFPWPRSLVDK